MMKLCHILELPILHLPCYFFLQKYKILALATKQIKHGPNHLPLGHIYFVLIFFFK